MEKAFDLDYPAELTGYSTTQIDIVAPSLPAQGDYDLYASALDGATRVYSNPQTLSVGHFVTTYGLDGAGNRDMVAYNTGTLAYTMDPSSPDPADFAMNQYTTVPGESVGRSYDENGNLVARDTFGLPPVNWTMYYESQPGPRRATESLTWQNVNGIPPLRLFGN